MTKELSKQICEKCGMPYEKMCTVTEILRDEKLIGEHVVTYDRMCSLDFGQPENFVKLLELKILTGCSLIGFLILKGVYWGNIRNFLMSLRIFLDNCDKTIAENIKQAIREAEWKYE